MNALGAAWYSPEAWQQLAALPEARIQKSYQDFVRTFEKIARDCAAKNIVVEKMPTWCHQHGYAVDTHGRAAYGAVQMSAPDDPNVRVIDNTRIAQ